jgi:hypothetical protein
MEFFDKLGKKASETYKATAEKTSKIAKEAKIKMKINDTQSEIEDLYKEIGRKVYEKHSSENDVCIKNEIEEECKKIDALAEEIEKALQESRDLKNKKQCEKCSTEIEKDAKFCQKCGAEQTVEEKKEETETEKDDVEPEIVSSTEVSEGEKAEIKVAEIVEEASAEGVSPEEVLDISEESKE